MSVPTITIPKDKLVQLGLQISDSIHYQLSPEELISDSLRRDEGVLSTTGALVIRTGEFTVRSPKGRLIVEDQIIAGTIEWHDFNQPLEDKYFDTIFTRLTAYLNKLPELWIRDCYVCADPRYR